MVYPVKTEVREIIAQNNDRWIHEISDKIVQIEKLIFEVKAIMKEKMTAKKFCCQYCKIYSTNDSSNFKNIATINKNHNGR